MFSTLRNYSKYVILLIVLAMVITGGLYGFGSYLNRGTAQNNSNTNNNIAAVNGNNITQEQYYAVLQQQAPRTRLESSQVIPFRFNILESLINQELILQHGEELGIEPGITDLDVDEYVANILEVNEMTEEELKSYLSQQGTSLSRFKRSLKASLEQNDIMTQARESTYSNLTVSEEEIARAYEKADIQVIVKSFTGDNKEEAREEINKALASIQEGREFTAAAAEYSDLKYNEGNLGKVGRENNFVPAEIVERALEMEVGQLSPVIEEGQSFYLVKLQDKQTASGEKYEEARAGIEENLLTEKQNQAFSNWLNNTRAEAEIEVYDPVLRGYRALQNANYDQAVEDFKMLVEENPTPMIYTYLAQAYRGSGQIDQAEATYEQAAADYPEDWMIHFNYGALLAGKEEPAVEKAVSLLDKASELSGDNFTAHYQLYLAYSQLGQEEKAEAELTKLNDIQKKMQEAQENAERAADNGDSTEAESDSTAVDAEAGAPAESEEE